MFGEVQDKLKLVGAKVKSCFQFIILNDVTRCVVTLKISLYGMKFSQSFSQLNFIIQLSTGIIMFLRESFRG